MKELKLSDFKMFEKAPYKLPPPSAFTKLAISSLREEEKMYGPVFSSKIIKNFRWFVAQKIGEEPPEDIETLEQMADFLISISDKHPIAYSAILYSQFKTENELQGQTGAGTQTGAIGFSRTMTKSPNIKERNVNLDDLLSKYRQTWVEVGVAHHEFGYKKNEDGSVDIIFPECYVKDGCRMCFDEGLMKRPVGGLQCGHSSVVCQFFKLLTGYEWDYKLLEFDKPQCIANCYMT
nr:hypothetical protein [Candidatus Freyarchaeota archaeon]